MLKIKIRPRKLYRIAEQNRRLKSDNPKISDKVKEAVYTDLAKKGQKRRDKNLKHKQSSNNKVIPQLSTIDAVNNTELLASLTRVYLTV